MFSHLKIQKKYFKDKPLTQFHVEYCYLTEKIEILIDYVEKYCFISDIKDGSLKIRYYIHYTLKFRLLGVRSRYI